MNVKQTTKGFTIIEVVLVLAIAGLIFLMVFIALPALQSGQRDTARKDDVSIISTAVSNYVSQNKGSFPAAGSTTIRNYIKGLSSNTPVTSVNVASYTASVTATDGTATIYLKSKCGSPGTGAQYNLTSSTATRDYVVVTYLEGGSGIAYCQEGSI